MPHNSTGHPLISLFSLNDPYRMVGILVLVIALRLPLMITGIPETLSELNWMLVGEKLSSGSSMYSGVWDNLAPLSAGTYWILDWIFGRSPWAHHLMALLVVIVQSYLFNDLLLKNKAYNQNTYVPALIYVVLMNCFFDFTLLSPALLSLTFLLLSLNNVFRRIDKQTKDEFFLNTGIYLGIATLFYLPGVVFLPALILSLLFFTASILRRYLLLLYGFFLPIAITWVYYYWIGASFEFSKFFLGSLGRMDSLGHLAPYSLMIIGTIPALFTFLALWKIRGARYVNYQVRFQYVMVFIILSGFLSMFLAGRIAPNQAVVLVPSLAFFISHFFLLVRRGFLREVIFVIFLGGIVLVFWGSFFKAWGIESRVSYETLLVGQTEWDDTVKGKRAFVFGQNLSIYRYSQPATPFLNWKLSSEFLGSLDFYDNLDLIFRSFENDPPEVIIDLENRVPNFFERLPIIACHYQSKGNGIYLRKESSN